LLDLSLFKSAHASLAVLVCITAGLVVFVLMFFDPLYLESIRQQDAFIVGLTLLCVPVAQVIISLLWEKIMKKFKVLDLLLLGLLLPLLAAVCHAFFSPSITILFVLLVLVLMGYTWGIANTGTITALTQAVEPQKMGGAIGTMFTFWNLCGSIALALATVVFHWQESTSNFMNAFHWVAWCTAGVMLVIFLVGLRLRK
jgi:MFS family permease